jgi:tRNA A-37 threonylcarbamoyl transferase component Bud32
MRLQIASPSQHPELAALPFANRLDDWDLPNVSDVGGLHRHIVRLVEYETESFVVKELPDRLALREYRLFRELAEAGLPTAEVVAVLTGKPGVDGMVITRHLDYSLPYRSLLSGRGLIIPYLGERVLDAMVGLLVRLHLGGFFWGDCSLSNTLFRRDAGALSAYIIDLETGEQADQLSPGQRALDLEIATNNVAGGLLDLQAAGRLADGIDPIEVALAIEGQYERLWAELTDEQEIASTETFKIRQRLERLHELGFDVEEMDIISSDDGSRLRFVPRVVEHGYHAERLADLTGLDTQENQARKLLNAIREFGAWLQDETGKSYSENVTAVRWMDRRFEPTIAKIPAEMFAKLEPAEIYVQVLEHRWFLSEAAGHDVGPEEALDSYLADVLAGAPDEVVRIVDDEE